MSWRRNFPWVKVFLASLMFGTIFVGFNQHITIQRELHSKSSVVIKCVQERESIAAQLQVVYEHKARLEKSVADERNELQKTKDELTMQRQEFESKFEKNKQDGVSRINSLHDEHRMLQNQHDDLQREYASVRDQHYKLTDEHRQSELKCSQRYSELQQSKADEVSQLQQKLLILENDNGNLQSNLKNVEEKLQRSELLIEQLQSAQNTRPLVNVQSNNRMAGQQEHWPKNIPTAAVQNNHVAAGAAGRGISDSKGIGQAAMRHTNEMHAVLKDQVSQGLNAKSGKLEEEQARLELPKLQGDTQNNVAFGKLESREANAGNILNFAQENRGNAVDGDNEAEEGQRQLAKPVLVDDNQEKRYMEQLERKEARQKQVEGKLRKFDSDRGNDDEADKHDKRDVVQANDIEDSDDDGNGEVERAIKPVLNAPRIPKNDVLPDFDDVHGDSNQLVHGKADSLKQFRGPDAYQAKYG